MLSQSSQYLDKQIKQLLKQLKRLEVDLAKFTSKHPGVLKTNILRTTLLPFLRSSTLEASFPPDSRIYKSLASISTVLLLKWWATLLAALTEKQQPVSSTDRNAYLECISRIIARHEWLHEDDLREYQNMLVSTMEYCIDKLQVLKFVPIATSAFVGKVFAYSFFHLPKVSSALLFLLNVKQLTLEATNAFLPPAESDKLAFPSHVQSLVDFHGVADLPRRKKAFINAVPPPTHPVAGIKDPNGSWVRRWCNSDSDVFNSFLRHYIHIVEAMVASSTTPPPLSSCPGFSVLLAHISQIFSMAISRIMSTKTTTPPNVPLVPGPRKESSPPPPDARIKQLDVYHNSIIKIFRILRDITYSDSLYSDELTKLIDLVFVNLAKQTSIHDCAKSGLVLNVFQEFCNHVTDVKIINWEFWLGCAYTMLSHLDHLQMLLKNLAFLFNLWDLIPELLPRVTGQPHLEWISDPNKSLKLNLTDWLVSNAMWLRFFAHWNPIVRSFYIKLLVWRVIGVNNLESSIGIQVTQKVEKMLLSSYQGFINNHGSFALTPDSPLVNRKFAILPTNLKNEFLLINNHSSTTPSIIAKPSELRKTHPFEVFDEAIYSCSSLPTSPGQPPVRDERARGHSLVNSLGRLFKILSADDSESKRMVHSKSNDDFSSLRPPSNLLRSKRNSVSLTSLSTAYLRSLSPSIMSHQSTPTSLTDFSTELSITLDSDLSFADFELSDPATTQPPELFRIPPEIIRPMYKFDITVDNDSLGERYTLMNTTNKSHRKFSAPSERVRRLETPRIPAVTIFPNSDSFNKFFISTDNLLTTSEELGMFEPDDAVDLSGLQRACDWNNLGKSLAEWNVAVEEFHKFLVCKVEEEQNFDPDGDVSESKFLKKIIPFLPVDGSNEFKLINAA